MANKTFWTLVSGRGQFDTVLDATLIPSSDEKDALVGTSGTPSTANKLVTDADSRMTDARTPASHNNTYHSETYITSAGVTYGNLDTNGDIGTVVSTVAAGNDSRFPTDDQKNALAGSGTPSAANTYTTETWVEASITYEQLDTNGDVGAVVDTLAAGNDARFPTSDEKAALVAPGGYSPSDTDRYVTVNYVTDKLQGLDWHESVERSLSYVIASSDPPTNPTGTTLGEYCYRTDNHHLFEVINDFGHQWSDLGVVSSGYRLIFKDSGTDTSGNSGTYTADKKVREWNGTSTDEFTPNEGWALRAEDTDEQLVYNGTDWIQFGSTTTHNNLSGLQGGTTNEFYHITSDQEAGLDASTAIASSNPVITKSDRDWLPCSETYLRYNGIDVSQTDQIVYQSAGNFDGIVMPAAGSLVKATLQSVSARTAGTLTVEPTIDGTKAANSALDLILDGTTTNDDTAEVAPATITFTSGQKIGAKVSTDASWAPTTSTFEYKLFFVFDS